MVLYFEASRGEIQDFDRAHAIPFRNKFQSGTLSVIYGHTPTGGSPVTQVTVQSEGLGLDDDDS